MSVTDGKGDDEKRTRDLFDQFMRMVREGSISRDRSSTESNLP